MVIWAISDLHLSFSHPKPMDIFGEHWRSHAARIAAGWRERVSADDVVCLPGDLSWALRLSEVRPELKWLASLPGTKILLRGNHDYWWSSLSKLRQELPPGIFALQNDALRVGCVGFAGARGWVDASLDFSRLFQSSDGQEGGRLCGIRGDEEDARLYRRELDRLERSLRLLDPEARYRVALLHFPPTSPRLEETPVTRLLEKFRVDAAVFGHLHGEGSVTFANPYGERNGIVYHLVSADFAGFAPVEILRTGGNRLPAG